MSCLFAELWDENGREEEFHSQLNGITDIEAMVEVRAPVTDVGQGRRRREIAPQPDRELE